MDGAGEQELDRAIVTLWRIRFGAFVVVLVLIALVVLLGVWTAEGPLAVTAVGLAVLVAPFVVLAWRLPAWIHRQWRYTLGPEALEIRHGAVFRQRSVVPYFRVQHADISSGPLERKLGLVRLRLRTASAGTDGEIPGLTEEAATAARDRILARAGTVTGL